MDRQHNYEIACRAVEKLVNDLGTHVVFPFDKIWQYADEEVPSTQRSHQWKRLVKEGYLDLTGEMTKAASEERAGSVTREYRPGKRFQPRTIGTDATSAIISNLQRCMDARGMMITPAEIANFYLAMLTSPIVILAGLSGTGKSWMPRLFAELTDCNFQSISVQPQWSDNADLFGYTSSLNPTNFHEGPFTSALRDAFSRKENAYIVLLDEMNLAAVEHYFSDFLSVVETRRRKNGAVITDPIPLDLPLPAQPDNYEELRNFSLPVNIRVVGTSNMDETTRAFSPKVVDRAFVIEFNDIDLTSFPSYSQIDIDCEDLAILSKKFVNPALPIVVGDVYESAGDFFDWLAALLEEIRQILWSAGISFGFRSRDAILLYMWHWQNENLAGILTPDAAFDLCILQKILPKISGTGEVTRDALEELSGWLSVEHDPGNGVSQTLQVSLPRGPFQRSVGKVQRMIQKLDTEGVTTYWGS